ncbi:MAG TPA: lipoprotein-releasing ABC transporter permease subunit [Caulobacteraceae bacterium]|jgi:lipoprotein-releasing system permease protein|nr:lipoprotein-releasing ABC transporter permease subunit [Caulobacteraceae bacterium]
MGKPAVYPTAGPFSAWERSIAARYLRAKRKHGGVALISLISFVGVTLAVAVLIIVMSVMNGFRTELLTRILGFNGHIYVSGPAANGPGREAMIARLRAVPGVVQVVPVVEAQAMVTGPTQITGGIVRGMRPADLAATSIIAGNMRQGSLKGFGEGDYGGDIVLVGARLAETVGVKAGDTLSLISPSAGATVFGAAPRRKSYTVGGVFSVGMSEYDAAFIYMPMEQAQLFFGRDSAIDLIEVNLADPDSLDKLLPAVRNAAGAGALVTDWRDRNHSFFNALQVERTTMRLILMMIVAIAAMNIISGLVMLVKNKSRDIAILRTMGASQMAILRIFFMAGASIGALGTLTGLVLGSLFCIFIDPIQSVVERVTGVSVFSPDTYFLARIPARIEWSEVAIVTLFSLLMSFIWTLPPAWRASRLDPVEALRYE